MIALELSTTTSAAPGGQQQNASTVGSGGSSKPPAAASFKTPLRQRAAEHGKDPSSQPQAPSSHSKEKHIKNIYSNINS